jgi:prepilin-type N-terminal cleavage/methylation domain-containing protein
MFQLFNKLTIRHDRFYAVRVRELKAKRGGEGFTLIETLIALVVAATAAAVILGQLRVLVARVEQERRHELAVLHLLNDGARLSFGSPGGEVLTQLDANTMQIRYRDPAWPAVMVGNFSATGQKVPPLMLAYTPFQLYTVSEGSYTLSQVAPGIQRPDAIMPKTAAAPVVTSGVPGLPKKVSLSPVMP